MFCPKCKAEYREGFYGCADCEIDLVYELPPEAEQSSEEPIEYLNLVNIEKYYIRHEADLAKGLLSANGIYAFIQGGEFRRSGRIRLLVKEEDAEEAIKILSEIKEPDNTLEPTPSENSINKIASGMWYLIKLILIACIIMLILYSWKGASG